MQHPHSNAALSSPTSLAHRVVTLSLHNELAHVVCMVILHTRIARGIVTAAQPYSASAATAHL
eukprot:39450-Alexandrium_andersonii.AAC.1